MLTIVINNISNIKQYIYLHKIFHPLSAMASPVIEQPCRLCNQDRVDDGHKKGGQ